MHYLSIGQILLIHSMVIDETSGSHGIRDRHALLAVEHLAKQTFGGEELYPSLFLKAAVYARNIIQGHPFIDGNKRSGMVCASVFLENNGYKITAKKGTIEKFAMKMIHQKLGLEDIAHWFKENAQKI